MAKANGRGDDGDKAKAIELAMTQIEKQYKTILELGNERAKKLSKGLFTIYQVSTLLHLFG